MRQWQAQHTQRASKALRANRAVEQLAAATSIVIRHVCCGANNCEAVWTHCRDDGSTHIHTWRAAGEAHVCCGAVCICVCVFVIDLTVCLPFCSLLLFFPSTFPPSLPPILLPLPLPSLPWYSLTNVMGNLGGWEINNAKSNRPVGWTTAATLTLNPKP